MHLHIVEDRIVLTWTPDGRVRGVITGHLHTSPARVFAVEHIVACPGQSPRAGLRMCLDLLPLAAQRLGLAAVLVVIHATYRARELRLLARALGFALYSETGPIQVWRKEMAA